MCFLASVHLYMVVVCASPAAAQNPSNRNPTTRMAGFYGTVQSPPMNSQAEKAEAFRELHARARPFLIPNPWDRGSALILESMGFEALATTSLGVANVLGVRDVTLQQVLDNCRAICETTSLPVNADLENCFADEPREAAKAIQLACEG